MTQENVEIVRSMYDFFNRRDWDAAFRNAHPEFELTTPPGPFNAGTHRGRKEVEGYLQDWLATFEASSIEPEEFFERGDQVVVFVKARARPKGSSAEIEIRNGHLWAIRNGKAVSQRVFPEPKKALEAAELRE